MNGGEWSTGYVEPSHDIGCELEYEYDKRPDAPRVLSININNSVSMKYGGRPGIWRSGAPVGMDEELFCRIIDDFAAAGGKVVNLCPHCEPFAFPEGAEFAKYAARQGLKLYFETDMRSVDEKLLDSLINAGADARFKIYCGGIFEETYRKTAGFGSWESMDNIKTLKRKYDNILYLLAFNNYFLPFEQDVLEFYWNYHGIAVVCERQQEREMPGRKLRLGMGCPELLNSMTVDVDGSVVLCQRDIYMTHRLGSLHSMTIKDVWNGAELAEITADVYKRVDSGRELLCNRCDKVCLDCPKTGFRSSPQGS